MTKMMILNSIWPKCHTTIILSETQNLLAMRNMSA